MKVIDIGAVSKQSGVPSSTLRFYEEVGLISAVGWRGLRRQFGPETLVRLSLIALGQAAGFKLSEIASMFGTDGKLRLRRSDLHAKVNELERQIAKLRALRKLLHHVAECPAPTHLECPKFQRLLKLAGRRKREGRKII
jgi:DNA-binding transcriptional MerR regulator